MSDTSSLDALLSTTRSTGDDDAGSGFAADFYSRRLGDPFLEGTGYLPTREDAEAFADEMIPLLDAEARPEADVWCCIVSAERRGDPTTGSPVVEDTYPGLHG